VNGAYAQEAIWASQNLQAYQDLLAQGTGWPKPVIEKFTSYKTQYSFLPADSKVAERLQRAADWLSQREVIPGKIEVAKHLINVGSAT
jgi:sulfonate transport system substrate-binding protein